MRLQTLAEMLPRFKSHFVAGCTKTAPCVLEEDLMYCNRFVTRQRVSLGSGLIVIAGDVSVLSGSSIRNQD